jgi:Fungal N-terminal domain of STAND proteins
MPMDPIAAVGLVASASQLAGQALSIVISLWKLGTTIKNAPKYSAELRQEMGTLCDLLDSLDQAIKSTQFVCSASLNSSCQKLKSMLDEMNDRVKPSQSAGLNRLKWPFTMDENKRLISRISRYKETFNLALNIQTAYSNFRMFTHL